MGGSEAHGVSVGHQPFPVGVRQQPLAPTCTIITRKYFVNYEYFCNLKTFINGFASSYDFYYDNNF